MQIVTVQFNYDGGPDYKKLLDVFRYSCNKHMPDAEFIEYKIDPPDKKRSIPYNFIYNTDKLEIWAKHMRETKDNVIFADCDMLCTADASSAFNSDFDIGYTERTRIQRIPMNGGIVFAKPNPGAVQFFDKWDEINKRMIYNDINGNGKLHHKYRVKWAGMNQAAFGWMMDHPEEYETKIKVFKTKEWNAVDCDWSTITAHSDVKFIHYKSRLRKIVLQRLKPAPEMAYCRKVWDNIYTEMSGEIIEAPEPKVIVEQPRPFKKYKPRKV